MKTRKIFSVLFAPVVLMALTMNCGEEDGITYSLNDVSSRITGFGSPVTGAGAALTVNGSKLDNVQRICIGDYCVAKALFTSVSESSIVFTVPTAVPTGDDTDVLFVFSGSDRAYKAIDVIPFQAVSSFTPYSAGTGETVTVYGANLDIVDDVKLGTVSADITSQSATMLRFTVPAGITTGKITLVSEAGSANSTADLTSCGASPAASDCPAGLNMNTSFEDGTGDNFDNWVKNNGAGYLLATTVPSETFRGSRALKVVRDGTLASGQWRIQTSTSLVTTEVGASYTVYVWARASAPGAGFRVSLSPDTGFYPGDVAVTTAWQRFSFVVPGDRITTTSTRFVLDLNGTNTAVTTFFIDDVKVVKNN